MSCPICQKPADRAYRPFCSKRCADVDLGRWLKGSYAIPDETTEVTETVPQNVSDEDETRH